MNKAKAELLESLNGYHVSSAFRQIDGLGTHARDTDRPYSYGIYGNATQGQHPGYRDGLYLDVPFCSFSDYSGTIVERSNHRAFREAFDPGEGLWYWDVSGWYGTEAIIVGIDELAGESNRLVAIGMDDEDDTLAMRVAEWLNALEDYPLADEDLHSEMEEEAKQDAWESWVSEDFRRAMELEYADRYDFDDMEDETLASLFWRAYDLSGECWECETGGNMWIDVEKVSDHAMPFPRTDVRLPEWEIRRLQS